MEASGERHGCRRLASRPWPRLGAVIGALNISTLRGRLGDEVSIRLCMIVMGVCVAAVASSRSPALSGCARHRHRPFRGSGSTRCGQEERPGLPRGRIRPDICPRDRPPLRGCNGLALVVRLTGCMRTSDIRRHAAVQKATNYRTENGRCQSESSRRRYGSVAP